MAVPTKRRKRTPSYNLGHLRDPEIERLQGEQNPAFEAEDLKRAIKKAIPRRPGRGKAS